VAAKSKTVRIRCPTVRSRPAQPSKQRGGGALAFPHRRSRGPDCPRQSGVGRVGQWVESLLSAHRLIARPGRNAAVPAGKLRLQPTAQGPHAPYSVTMPSVAGYPSLSVIIPTHETRELVLRCLDSLRPPYGFPAELEVIVVDDGSSDGTSEAIRLRFPGIRILRHDQATGFSRAASAGLDAAAGSWRLLLNSDTRLPEGSLDTLMRRFHAHSDPEIIGARLLDPDGTPQWSGGAFPTSLWLFALVSGLGPLRAKLLGNRKTPADSSGSARPVDWVSGAAMAFRAEVWEKLRPLDDGFAFYAQDLDFCYRGRAAGIPSVLLPEFRVIHEHGGTVRMHSGAVAGVEPEKLWPDLLRFVAMHRSPRVYRRTRRIMLLGAGLRLAGRRCAGCFVTGASGLAWRDDTERFRRAAARLSRNAASP